MAIDELLQEGDVIRFTMPLKLAKRNVEGPANKLAIDSWSGVETKVRGQYVVETAEMTGGGYAMFNDYYPDAWHVTVRRLNNGSYTPRGKTIEFTQDTNCYNSVIDDDAFEVIGKMKRTYR